MENKPSREDQFLAIIDQIIDDNIDNEKFSVEDLAQKAGFSRSTLHRKLKKLTGQSAGDRITETRLKQAKDLLENDVATVSEIAFQVGFSDPSYFTKVFKKYFHISPGNVSRNLVVDQHTLSTKQNTEIFHSTTSKAHRLIVKAGAILFVIIIAGGIAYYLFRGLRPSEISIAVLPFHNLTGQLENAYFVDGLHDALIGELGKLGQIDSLRVISRTSTLPFRNSNMLLHDIARELGVNFIIEGSVMGAGDSLKFLIQLIDVFPKEHHLLVNEYHDEMHNVLKLQTTAVKDIAQKIRIKLSKDDENLLEKSRTVDPETYRAYLRGMYYLNQGTTESIQTGVDYLVKAIERDPGDPFAYAGFALAKAVQGHGMIAPEESFRSAAAAADKALRIDNTNDEAHTALALLYLYQYWDWPKAQEAFEKAVSNNPNNAIAHAHYAWYHVLVGDLKKSLFHAKRAVDIEPLSASYQSWLAWLYYDNEKYDQAELWANKSLELSDNNPFGNMVLGWTYLKKKKFRKAIETHEKLPDNTPRWKWFRCRTYMLAGDREKALSIWNDLEESSKEQWVNPFYMGMIAGILGFTDRAFELFNEACDNKYFPMIYIDVFPSAEYVKNDPRYSTLLQKINLPYDRTMLSAQ